MYESYYGLRSRPFDLTPNPRYLFLSARHREALSTLHYALTGPRGLAVLLGEAGTGKTTLVQAALMQAGSTDLECVLLSNPTLTRSEFYEFLAESFQFSPDVARSKAQFLTALRRHLEARLQRGLLTALVIDEAQSVPYELLEEVRLLGNLETPTTKLLSVVLTGQPELAERLNEPRLRQLKQRIGLRCELAVFDLAETAAYIATRLRVSGGSPTEIFTRNAVESIYRGSGGVPRAINVIGENALIGGFAAQARPIPRALVEAIVRDFDLAAPPEPTVQSARPPADERGPESPASERSGALPGEQAASEVSEAPLFGSVTRRQGFSLF